MTPTKAETLCLLADTRSRSLPCINLRRSLGLRLEETSELFRSLIKASVHSKLAQVGTHTNLAPAFTIKKRRSFVLCFLTITWLRRRENRFRKRVYGSAYGSGSKEITRPQVATVNGMVC